jgi:hypothetical protein
VHAGGASRTLLFSRGCIFSAAFGDARASYQPKGLGYCPITGGALKALMLVGVLLLVLGVISLFVPFPHSRHHGVRVGDAHVGVTTHDDEKVTPVVSIVLIVAGAGLMIAGRRS